jgi:hypothetical protein
MSGRGGLGDKFFGDSDQITPTPNRRYLIADSQMAAGTFNPFMRDGLLSPSVNTFQTLTADQTFLGVAGSSIYDHINDDFYLAERSSQIFQGDGLSDTSLARVKAGAWTATHDLEIYQTNGVRKLFYVYEKPATSVLATTLGSSVNFFFAGEHVRPITSGSVPTITSSTRATQASGTTVTQSFTTSAGTNGLLLVYAMNYTATAATAATFNGVAMTLNQTSTLGSKSITTFYTVAPAAMTANVVVTWPSSQTNQVVNIFYIEGANQTTPLTAFSAGGGTSTSAGLSTQQSVKNVLFLAMLISATATHTIVTGTQVFNTTNTSGNDSTSYVAVTTQNLDVGIATLPFTTVSDTWLTSSVSGAFTNTTTSSYNFIRTADNGYAYLFADNTVNKIDGTTQGGTNGTITPNSLVFPPYFRLTDAVDYRGNMLMVIHQTTTDTTSTTQTNFSTPCGVYIWDRQTQVVRISDFIPVEGVRQIKKIYVAPNGAVRIQCISSEGITQIREFTGSVFNVIAELGVGATVQYPDGLIVAGSKTMWLATDGSIYAHGRTRPSDGEVIARIGRAREPQAETTAGYSANITAGAILYGYSTDTAVAGYRDDRQALLFAYSDGTLRVKRFFPFDKTAVAAADQLAHQGDIYTGLKPLPLMSTVQTVNIFMAQGTATGTTVQANLKIYFNGSATPWATKPITRNDIARGYINIKVGKPYITSIQFETEYNTTAALSDTYDFHPYYAEIDYTPTSALQAA